MNALNKDIERGYTERPDFYKSKREALLNYSRTRTCYIPEILKLEVRRGIRHPNSSTCLRNHTNWPEKGRHRRDKAVFSDSPLECVGKIIRLNAVGAKIRHRFAQE